MLFRLHLLALVWTTGLIECTIREENEVLACHNEVVHLNCRSTDSVLVIYSATFATDGSVNADHCPLPSLFQEKCYDDVTLIVNGKCSGFTSCHFQVSDLIPRTCFGEGVLSLKYGCAPERHIVKYCSVEVTGSVAEGFIHNPGYPNFYPGLSKCTWTIRADRGQQVLLTVLDMSMQHSATGAAIDCKDSLQVFDGNMKLMHACGQEAKYLHTMKSNGNVVRIVFSSSDVWPSRGVLFYYRVLGCPTLPAPEHGYLVFRNASMAHYMCCARHVFVDDYKRNRFLYCLNGNRWNGSFTPCKNVRLLRKWQNTTGVKFEEDSFMQIEPVHRVAVQPTNFVIDVMIPSIIMAVMILCNVIIVIVILKKRRKKEEAAVHENSNGKSDMEPQPSTSKENGLDKEEIVTTV